MNWRKTISCISALICISWISGPRAEVDVLERPALLSSKASSSVLLGITKVGNRLVSVGERGIVVCSDDGGLHWFQSQVPVSVSLVGVAFSSEQEGWVVGHSGVLLHSRDGGRTWTKQLDGLMVANLVLADARKKQSELKTNESQQLTEAERMVEEGPSKPLLDIAFVDERNGFIAGAFGILLATHDGGNSWLPAMERIDNPKGKHLYSVKVLNNEVFIVGEQGAVFYSNDSGQTFKTRETPYAGTFFGSTFVAPHTAIIFGMRGNAFLTEDGGGTWHQIVIPTKASITAGLMLRDKSLVISDETGALFVSRDAGRTFQLKPASSISPYTSLVEVEDGVLAFSGVHGVSRLAMK